jgi:nitroreductase
MPDPVPPTVAALLRRRSVKRFVEPGPTDAQLELILRAATTVPDHNELHPWRFVVVSGEERRAFGEALVAGGLEADPDLDESRQRKLFDKAFLAPTFVVIVFSPKSGNVAEWEQQASAATTGYAMALTAHLLGLASIWKSASVLSGTMLMRLLGLTGDERLMGWVNLGTAMGPPRDRRNPVDPSQVASRLVSGRPEPWDQFEAGQA